MKVRKEYQDVICTNILYWEFENDVKKRKHMWCELKWIEFKGSGEVIHFTLLFFTLFKNSVLPLMSIILHDKIWKWNWNWK